MSKPDSPKPDLSIIIPTFRREAQLREAVLSVLSITELSIEILVEDDSPEGSARQVMQALADPRLHYSQRAVPTGGRPAIVRNEAAAKALGNVLYFLDDDDRALPHNLLKAYAALTASAVGVLVSIPQPFGANPARVQEEIQYFAKVTAFLNQPRNKFTMAARMLFGSAPLVCSTCLVKATAFAAVHGFDETIPVCEDVEFYMRAIRASGFLFQRVPILERRVGEASLISAASSDKFAQSYHTAQHKYRAQHGLVEFLALKVWSKWLDWTVPRQN